MGFPDDDPRRHELRTGFDRAAEDYQRTRPVCPPALFDDLMDLAGLETGGRVLEIGSTRALGEVRSADFLARVRRRLESLGLPQLTATFVAFLIVGRRA